MVPPVNNHLVLDEHHRVTVPSLVLSLPSIMESSQVLDNLDSHLKKSEYFRFLWFPHSENVSIIYQDHTNKEGRLSAAPPTLTPAAFLHSHIPDTKSQEAAQSWH
ncbi:Hypothetical predicted protein [Marmota monax]|uniref:D-arabinono-1,4-lactone oxidase C-terminal domain-containing protein n=1 Tax=Marmota monax TaxID=9995 RepID=A0A5E4BLB2_MARMO|nr:hypothetical protein GHT09_020527 [Marmota monax]VTJ69442.1 Hypothetical predicted protein [Marmota monax]